MRRLPTRFMILPFAAPVGTGTHQRHPNNPTPVNPMSKLSEKLASFALNVVAAASTVFVMVGSLLLAPLILAGIWLSNYAAGEALA